MSEPYERWLPSRYTERSLSKIIVEAAGRKILGALDSDVAIVGAGPAGLTAAWLLAEKGFSVLVLERALGAGGGMRGGSMLLPVGLIEEGRAASIAREAGVKLEKAAEGIYVVDPTELAAKLTCKAVDAGALIVPGVEVEDLVVEGEGPDIKVKGVVANLAPALDLGWHIDPLFIEARAVVDATGHDANLLRIMEKRFPGLVKVPGMSSLDVWRGEKEVVEKTGEVLPGLFAAGMSVAEVHNTRRMGPVFGGMLVSGAKVADMIAEKLSRRS